MSSAASCAANDAPGGVGTAGACRVSSAASCAASDAAGGAEMADACRVSSAASCVASDMAGGAETADAETPSGDGEAEAAAAGQVADRREHFVLPIDRPRPPNRPWPPPAAGDAEPVGAWEISELSGFTGAAAADILSDLSSMVSRRLRCHLKLCRSSWKDAGNHPWFRLLVAKL